jgi:hypothetical protein
MVMKWFFSILEGKLLLREVSSNIVPLVLALVFRGFHDGRVEHVYVHPPPPKKKSKN